MLILLLSLSLLLESSPEVASVGPNEDSGSGGGGGEASGVPGGIKKTFLYFYVLNAGDGQKFLMGVYFIIISRDKNLRIYSIHISNFILKLFSNCTWHTKDSKNVNYSVCHDLNTYNIFNNKYIYKNVWLSRAYLSLDLKIHSLALGK